MKKIFYIRDPEDVAKDLLGKIFVRRVNEKVLEGKQEHEIRCLELTYDNMILKREYFEKMAKFLIKFYKQYKEKNSTYICHLESIANDILLLKNNQLILGVCFNWTSVCDAWYVDKTKKCEHCECEW